MGLHIIAIDTDWTQIEVPKIISIVLIFLFSFKSNVKTGMGITAARDIDVKVTAPLVVGFHGCLEIARNHVISVQMVSSGHSR